MLSSDDQNQPRTRFQRWSQRLGCWYWLIVALQIVSGLGLLACIWLCDLDLATIVLWLTATAVLSRFGLQLLNSVASRTFPPPENLD